MNQGFSGSQVQRVGNLVEKVSSDLGFMGSPARQEHLIALSRSIGVLPRIDRIDDHAIYMDFIEGQEGLYAHNAARAGQALRQLHARTDYPFPCDTGVTWLTELANDSFSHTNRGDRITADIAAEYPTDALIHSEPVQFIQRTDGSIILIDFEGIGMGSRYQDIGYVYYTARRDGEPDIYARFMDGYQAQPIDMDPVRIMRLAGIIACAYARFADFDARIELGLRLLNEAG